MAVRDELSRRCVLLKSVNETIQADDIRTSLSTVGENGERFYKYVEKYLDDVRWIVLLETEKAASKCIQGNSLTIKTEENEVFNVDIGYCPECVIPVEWIEEESETLHYTFDEEDHRKMEISNSDILNSMDVDDSLTEDNATYEKYNFDSFEHSEPECMTQPFLTETDQKNSFNFLDTERNSQIVSDGIQNFISESKTNQIHGMIEEDFRTSLQGFSYRDQNMNDGIDFQGNNSSFKLEVVKKSDDEDNGCRDFINKEIHSNKESEEADTRNSMDVDARSRSSFQQQDSEQDGENNVHEEPYFDYKDKSGFECEDYPTSVYCSDMSVSSTTDMMSNQHDIGKSAMMDSSFQKLQGLNNDPVVRGNSAVIDSSMEKSQGQNINDDLENEPVVQGKSALMESSMEKSQGQNINDDLENEQMVRRNSAVMGFSMEKSQDPNINDDLENGPVVRGNSAIMNSLKEEAQGPNINDDQENESVVRGNSAIMNSLKEETQDPNLNDDLENEQVVKGKSAVIDSSMEKSQELENEFSLQIKNEVVQEKFIPRFSIPKTQVKYESNSDRQNSVFTDDNSEADTKPYVEKEKVKNLQKKDDVDDDDDDDDDENLDTKMSSKNLAKDLKTNEDQSADKQIVIEEGQQNIGQPVHPYPHYHTPMMSQTHPNQTTANQIQAQMDWNPGFQPSNCTTQKFDYPDYDKGSNGPRMQMPQANWYYPYPMWHGLWPHNLPYPPGPMQTNPEQQNAEMAQPIMNPAYYSPQYYRMPAMFPSKNSNQSYLATSQSSGVKSDKKFENPTESVYKDGKNYETRSGTKTCTSSVDSSFGSDVDNSQIMSDIDDGKKCQKSYKRNKKEIDKEGGFDKDLHEEKLNNSSDKEERLHKDGRKDMVVRPKTNTASSKSSDSDAEGDCCGITVFMSSVITEELLKNYFENTRISGGDEIKHIKYHTKESRVYLEFYDHKAVDRIIEKGTEHEVSGVKLFVSRCPKEKVTPKVMDDYKVHIKGLNPSTNQDCLFDFLEVKCGVEATDILYGEDSDTVLVMFEDKPDINKLQKICKKTPLDGHHLEVYRVPLTRNIRVSNIGENLKEDDLRYYFENKRKSGGGTIAKIELYKEKGVCIITFRRPEVVESVCSRRHRLNNLKLDVEKFYRCLGLMGGKECKVPVELPPPITRSGIDLHIIKFLHESQPHKKALEKEMLKHHAKVEWPSDKNSDTLKFICTFNLNDLKASQILESWEKSVHDVADHFLDVITSVYISVAKETWKMVMDGLKQINITHPEGVIVISKIEDYTIVLAGHKTIVKPLHLEIEKIISKEESEFQEKHEIVTITKNLKSYQIQILYRNKFGINVKDMEVKIDLKKKQVIFCGCPANIKSLELQMYETLQKFVSKKTQISTGMKNLLFKKEISAMLNKEMEAKGVFGYWDINSSNNSLDMYAESISDAKDAIEIMNTCILEKSIPMQGMLGKFLSAPRWKKTLVSLEEIHQGSACIEGERGSITVTGSKNLFNVIVRKVEQEVNDYIEMNSLTCDKIFEQEGIFQYIEKYRSFHKKEMLQPLLEKYQIHITTIAGPSSFGYSVKGHRDGVERVKTILKQLMCSVQFEKFLISKTGAKEFFLSSKGHEHIRQAETISKCIIKVTGKHKKGEKNVSREKDFQKRGGNNRSELEPVLVAQCQHDDKRIIKVMEGDITKLKVDAIINAANEDMSHGGGIAAAIVKAGGQTIQDECYKYVGKHGSVSEGDAIFSQPGRLPCKLIIHTVGPRWKDGKNKEEHVLKKAIINSLKLASSKGMSSIAFPAISAGIFGYPLDLSTRAIIEAIKDYLSTEWKDSTILEVYICDVDQNTISSFIEALEKEYCANDVKMIENVDKPQLMREISCSCSESEDSEDEDGERGSDSDQSSHSDSENSEIDNTDVKGATGRDKLSYPSANAHYRHEDISSRSNDQQEEGSLSFGDRSSESYDQSLSSDDKQGDLWKPVSEMNKAMIKVKKEELSKHKADVIVNSTQSDLDLNAGILSRSLLMAAGNSMQVECRQRYPNGIKYGQVAVTKGGNLSCGFVYHGTLKRWDNGKGDALQTMETLVESCLELAGKAKVSSIAFPALGTGKLGYPADIAAKTMFRCIHKYLTQNKTTRIRQVNIVIYPKDVGTLKAFELVEDGYNSNSNPQHESKPLKYPHSPAVSEKSSYHGYTGDSHSVQPPQTKVGHLMVSIVIGDITKEKSDVIVNSTMDIRDLSKGAVSKAILRAAGSKIQDECLQKGKTFTSDKPVVTSSGQMHCKVIFHVKSQKEADGWEKVVAMCLFEAERRRFSSVSFPALGTGGLGCSPDDVAKAMFKAMRKFTPEPQHLKHVRIVVFQKNMVDRFIAGLDKKESEGFFAKVKDKLEKVANSVKDGLKSLTEEEPKSKSKVVKSQRSKAKKVESISFMIYSDSRDNIKKAKKKLEDSYDSEFNEKTLSGTYKDAITNLTEKQRAEIERICQKHDVTLKFHKHRGLIEFNGRKNNVNDAHGKVMEYIHGEDKKKDNYEKAKAISKYVQWYYKDSNKKTRMFSPDVNYELEMAHNKKEQKCYIKDKSGVSYIVDLKKMEETVVSQPGIKFVVERKETNAGGTARREKLSLPRTWTPMAPEDKLKVIRLKPGDTEFEKVKTKFTESAQAQKSIIQIERIQNKFLYQQYFAKRDELKLKNQGKNPERWLWHGTSPDTLTKINNNGFNRSYCGKNGTAYGQGVYFAVDASYSLRFCSADGNGQYHMYAVQVLTGDSCQGSSGMKFLPPKGSGTASHITYDSATDSPVNPSMFVIFHDSQAYPTYHIIFK